MTDLFQFKKQDERSGSYPEKTEGKAFSAPKKYFTARSILLFLAAVSGAVFLIAGYLSKESNQLDKLFGSCDRACFFSEDRGLVSGEYIESGSDSGVSAESENFVSQSENYKARKVAFGEVTAEIEDSQEQLEIKNIRSESFVSSPDGKVKLVISWQTNKSAKCEVEYSKINEGNAKKIIEADYGFNHGAVISGLELRNVYTYRVTAADKWNNKVNSGFYSVYSSGKAESVFDMISGEVNKIFGWVVKK